MLSGEVVSEADLSTRTVTTDPSLTFTELLVSEPDTAVFAIETTNDESTPSTTTVYVSVETPVPAVLART